MPYTPRLDILRQLRQARKVSQAEMARLCGLQGRQSQQTAGAWERGEITPSSARRGGMMRYLWDGLRLREEPATFEAVWELLVELWEWEPITDREWADFTRIPRPRHPDPPNPPATEQIIVERAPAPQITPQSTPIHSLTLPSDTLPPPAPLPPASVMPLSRNPFFVGRTQDLLTLAAALQDQQAAAISPVETAAATGLGGIGKTQLASEFVHRYGQFFSGGVFWLSFENVNAIAGEIAACGGAGAMELRPDFATRTLEEQVRLVQAAWQEPTPRLLVFDNCEEPELVARWRPISGGCRILITSRRGDWDPQLNVQPLALAVFARHESIALLRRHAPDAPAAMLDAIAAELGDLPLALHLAGSYLYRYRRAIRPEQYLAHLRDPNLLRHPSFMAGGISPTAHVQHVGRTFALSYERLRPDEPRDALAIRLLMHMACFAPGEPVWYDVLVQTLDLDPQQPADAVVAEDAFARLIELGLIQVEGEKGMRVHRLVALFAQEVAPEAARAGQRKIEETIYTNLQRANQEGIPLVLLPGNVHMRHVVDAALAQDALWGATLATELGRHLWHMGDYPGSRLYFEQALETRRHHLGDEAVETAQSYHELGYLLRDMSDFATGRTLLEKALALRVQHLGEVHADVADTLNELSAAYWYEGKIQQALATLERAYASCQKFAGGDHLVTAEVANNLGMVLLDGEKEAARARPYLEEALRIRRHLLGEHHHYTAMSYHNFGYVLEALDELERAKAAYEESLAIRQAVLTEDHPTTLMTMSVLGGLLTRMGEITTGRVYLERAVESATRTLGDAHYVTSGNLMRLGLNFQAAGDFARAHAYLQRALAANEKIYGVDSLNYARILEYLGKLFMQMQQWHEARNYLQRVLHIRQSLLAPTHPLIDSVCQLLEQLPDQST